MKKVKNFIFNWVWQLPQNLVGLIWKELNTVVPDIRNALPEQKYKIYYQKFKGSVSLGKYIFIYAGTSNIEKTIKHEVGHYKQSKMLGPLYLLVIGIPSIIWASLRAVFPYFRKYNYFDFYTEKWANKLVGLE